MNERERGGGGERERNCNGWIHVNEKKKNNNNNNKKIRLWKQHSVQART